MLVPDSTNFVNKSQGMRILSNAQSLRTTATKSTWFLTLQYYSMTTKPLKNRFLTSGRTRLHQKTVKLLNSLLSIKESIQEHTPVRALQPILDTSYTPK